MAKLSHFPHSQPSPENLPGAFQGLELPTTAANSAYLGTSFSWKSWWTLSSPFSLLGGKKDFLSSVCFNAKKYFLKFKKLNKTNKKQLLKQSRVVWAEKVLECQWFTCCGRQIQLFSHHGCWTLWTPSNLSTGFKTHPNSASNAPSAGGAVPSLPCLPCVPTSRGLQQLLGSPGKSSGLGGSWGCLALLYFWEKGKAGALGGWGVPSWRLLQPPPSPGPAVSPPSLT